MESTVTLQHPALTTATVIRTPSASHMPQDRLLCAAVLVGRIAGLAGPSVCPSVPNGQLTR